MHDVDDYPEAKTIPGLVVYRYNAPLFFANSEDFKRRALAAADQQAQPVAWYILNVEANVEVDLTGLEALDAVRENLAQRGTIFALARVKQDVLRDLAASGPGREDRGRVHVPDHAARSRGVREVGKGSPASAAPR